jgi:hypothetical protein
MFFSIIQTLLLVAILIVMIRTSANCRRTGDEVHFLRKGEHEEDDEGGGEE